MKVVRLVPEQKGWQRFDLSIGGFLVKNCRWHPVRGRVLFPQRHDKQGRRRPVVFAHGALVERLRDLLESGNTETARDRRPCVLKIHGFHESWEHEHRWVIFSFTVRGFTILGCRWLPERGSIQLPVTFAWDENASGYRKKQVVCAFGPHIIRLREALEAHFQVPKVEAEEEFVPVVAGEIDG
jgi:hypothetical protein